MSSYFPNNAFGFEDFILASADQEMLSNLHEQVDALSSNLNAEMYPEDLLSADLSDNIEIAA